MDWKTCKICGEKRMKRCAKDDYTLTPCCLELRKEAESALAEANKEAAIKVSRRSGPPEGQ